MTQNGDKFLWTMGAFAGVLVVAMVILLIVVDRC